MNFAGNDLAPITTSNPRDVIAYRRGNVAVLVNTRGRLATCDVSGISLTGSRDLISNRVQLGNTIELDGYGVAVLEMAVVEALNR